MSHTECKLRCLLASSEDSKKAAAYKTAEVGERYRLGITQQLWVQTGYLKLYHQSKESKYQELTMDSNINWRTPQRLSTVPVIRRKRTSVPTGKGTKLAAACRVRHRRQIKEEMAGTSHWI